MPPRQERRGRHDENENDRSLERRRSALRLPESAAGAERARPEDRRATRQRRRAQARAQAECRRGGVAAAAAHGDAQRRGPADRAALRSVGQQCAGAAGFPFARQRHSLQHAGAPGRQRHDLAHAEGRDAARGAGIDSRPVRLRVPLRRLAYLGPARRPADAGVPRQLPHRSAPRHERPARSVGLGGGFSRTGTGSAWRRGCAGPRHTRPRAVAGRPFDRLEPGLDHTDQ